MSEPKIVASAQGKKKAKPVDAAQVWAAVGWTCLAFLTVGWADWVLTWYPPSFGNREWEFGTVVATLNNIPILVLSTALLLAASVQIERRWWTAIVILVTLLMLLWIVAGVVLWATNVPLALSTVPIELATSIKKSIAKTLVQAVVYPTLLTFLLLRSFRAMRGPRADS